MEVLIIIAALFGIDNKEFIDTISKQLKNGYSWTYVGPQEPTGVPAITIKPHVGNEYILYKLIKQK
jgi:hypothetical protein